MYEPAPKKQSGRGAPRKKGERLSTRDEWAADASRWTRRIFDQYGLHAALETKTRNGLYYKAGKDRQLKFVLTRDTVGDRPTQIFYCTDLSMSVREILSAYSYRWSVEVTHHDAKQFLGLEDPANRLPLAVQRTAPMAMFLYSLTVLWYAEQGHKQVQFPNRPWYTRKREPSFADMLTTLRRVTWEDKLSIVRLKSSVCKKAVRLITYLATMDAAALATAHRQRQGLVEQSLEWTLNAKGMSQETLAQRELLAREAAANPRSADAAAKLQETRQKLAALAVSGNSDEQQQLRQDLAKREAELAHALSLSGAFRGAKDTWVRASQVRQALPADAALVEIVRLDRSRPVKSALAPFEANDADARYVAWVLSAADNPPRLIDLGAASAIEADVLALRKLVDGKEAEEAFKNDPVQATKDANAALESLSAKVLWPLLPHLRNSSHWIVSPDSQLWLIPWSALRLPDGAYVIERKTISHVVTGRDLLARSGQAAPLDYGVIMADPDYNLSAQLAEQASRQVPPKPLPDQFARRGDDRLLVSVPRDWIALPGTRKEAEAIRQPIEKLVGGKVHVLQKDRALEAYVKRWMHRPRVAVLATHGFFLHGEQGRLTNPLLRCGLIFVGANNRKEGDAACDDGVLTGMEVLQVDLRGTELVALSACDTGVGRVIDGEGVGGLRQAFHLAGAKGVISTLWKAPDHYTAILMKTFWESMSERLTPAEALRKAQRELIERCENELGAAHPWLWAAPTLTTQGQ